MKTYFKVILISIIAFLQSYNSFAQDDPIATLPFTFNENGLMVISLQVNNETVSDFVLDTGASITVIDKKIAKQLGLALKREAAQITGASAINNDVKKTQKQQLTITDKIVLQGIEMYLSDLSRIAKINGLIGYDLFKEFITETNFDTKTISFYEKKGKPDTKGYKSINFEERFCTPEIKLSVTISNNKSFTGKVFIDTGNVSSPFIFNSPFVTKHHLSSKFETLINTESSGINSTSNSGKGVVSSIKVNRFELSEIPVTLSNSKQGMLSKEAYMGNLGLKYVSKFNFILDYNRKKLYLKPNQSYDSAFDFPLSGIHLETKENGIFIKSIDKPSMAHKRGLKPRQQLVSINGVEGKSLQFYKELLKNENKEVTVVVKLENGDLKTVKILLVRLI